MQRRLLGGLTLAVSMALTGLACSGDSATNLSPSAPSDFTATSSGGDVTIPGSVSSGSDPTGPVPGPGGPNNDPGPTDEISCSDLRPVLHVSSKPVEPGNFSQTFAFVLQTQTNPDIADNNFRWDLKILQRGTTTIVYRQRVVGTVRVEGVRLPLDYTLEASAEIYQPCQGTRSNDVHFRTEPLGS
ncbi:MAG: hypothetical protein AB7G23_09200 [Vicinamibacterales bacterium]